MIKYFICLASLFISVAANAQKDTANAKSTMNEATVYFGYGAELTHKAKLNINTNTKYIVIDKLSTQLDQNSLQISCPESVSLLSQQYSVYYPTAKIKPVVKNPLILRINDTIKKLTKSVAAIQNKITIEETTMSRTDKLIESTIATSINKTALTAEVLKLIEFNNAKIEKNKKAIYDYQLNIAELEEQLTELNIRLADASKTKDDDEEEEIVEKPFGRIIMQVVCRQSMDADFSFSYYTTNAGWQPIYDIRVNSKTNNLKLVYKASLIQNTGIDWQKTKLTLSTGTPNFTTTAPLLNAWYLQYYVPQLYGKLKEAVISGYGQNSMQSFTDNDLEKVEVTSLKKSKTIIPSTLEKYTTLKEGILNTSFEIDLPYDIMSNGLAHSINIKEEMLKSSLKNYAVPKLDPEAYLVAELTDWQNLDLIPGNANIIMDDTYIGKSFIDPNSTADTLNLSLGKDKRVSVKRTLVKDATTSKNNANNTKQTFTYDLVVKNNKVKDINIILKDQYPLSNIAEVEVELIDSDGALINTDLGVLTWKITLKPGESIKKRFKYTVKYPRDKKIINLK